MFVLVFQNKTLRQVDQSLKRYSVCILCMHSNRAIFRRKMGGMVEKVGAFI